RQRRIGQARQVPALVDENGRLVLQALDLVVDLLQLARRRQQVLREVGGIEDDELRAGGGAGGRKRQRRSAGGERRAKSGIGHDGTSGLNMPAAQSKP